MQLFNFTGEQRVDTQDLTDATNTAILGAQDDLLGSVLMQPGVLKIVSGFAPTAQAATGPVQVGALGTPNVAFLGERSGAQVAYGRLMVGGQASQAVDITTFAAGTYNIYVRLTRLPDVPQNRTFWAALDQVEQARLTNTRLVTGWELRLEVALPSPEWFAIGTAQVVSGGGGQGNTVTVTDQRQMYFSGALAAGGAPTWGTAADRAASAQGGLVDLFTTLDALKSALVDIKGRGVAGWAAPNPVGMLVGPGFAVGTQATANRLAVGDAGFYLDQSTFGAPTLAFAGSTAALTYVRNQGSLQWQYSGQTVFVLSAQGSGNFGGTVAAHQQGPGYVVGAVGSDPTYGVGVGLTALGKQKGYIEIGAGFGSLGYFDLVADWSVSAPTVTLSTQGKSFVSTSNASGTMTTTVSGDRVVVGAGSGRTDLNGGYLYFNGKFLNTAMLPWASGVYIPGDTNSDDLYVLGTIANGQGPVPTANYQNDSGGHHSIQLNFPANFPPQATFILTGAYGASAGPTAGKVYQCGYQVIGPSSLVVGIANGADNPVNMQFTYYIIYGS